MIDEDIKKWIMKALNDLGVARHELNLPEDEMTTDAICFHYQQAAEKLLKAYLVFKNVEFKKIHQLELLLKICSEQDIDFKGLYIGTLSDYAVEIRYPETFYIPSVEEAKECFGIASKVKDFIFKKLETKEEELRENGKR
jgi:HEPN domain-containing protein